MPVLLPVNFLPLHMQQLVIASDNAGKIREIKQMIADIDLLSLKDIGFTGDIPEPYHSFEENALAKASTIHKFSGKNVFADDSGLCVHALHDAPGVDSAHYCGARDDEKNLQKVLDELGETTTLAGKPVMLRIEQSVQADATIAHSWEESAKSVRVAPLQPQTM